MRRSVLGRVIALGLIAIAAAACAGPERHAVPSALVSDAKVPITGATRFWGDEVPKDIYAFVQNHMPNVRRLAASATMKNGRPHVEYLALSGGAEDGAFGAGLLTGWSTRGDRPRFEVVTGVSAGALIAPYAYLGPRYDNQLAEVWRNFDSGSVATPQVLAGLFGADALADSTPLRELIKKHVNRRMLAEIAQEYRNGRLLLIGTTNLDAQRQVIWNMGEIAVAAARDPEAAQLFRDVLLASASLPGIFPPVHVKVRVGDKVFEEMHVDGGPTRQVFLAPAQFSLKTFDRLYQTPPHRTVYVIRNGKIGPEYEAVRSNVLAISARSLFTLTKHQGMGDINQIYAMTERDDAAFRLTSIPQSFNVKATKAFDPNYMQALFEVGRQLGQSGNAWAPTPPEAVRIAAQR
ncbi:MAG: patatin-like phospholipase family protein [Hyphomicrobium sp.]|uniref:patatin-like phospholipase family protein n=1 Tax=Hyphomicrobium sp. CS1BSMeth3 TaxID=1892844 RepID=UPI001160A494|nr:patatin-like phospholipase family protein [Hyphomicrobium sp. CS1BSMeth3]MBN9276118.1 patatin-like phospholipase family protein [Hyphomicrobium sp.]